MAALNPSLRFPVVLFDLGSTLIYFSGDWPEVIQQGQVALVQHLAASRLEARYRGLPDAAAGQAMEKYFSSRDDELIEHTTGAILRGLLSRWGYTDLPNLCC